MAKIKVIIRPPAGRDKLWRYEVREYQGRVPTINSGAGTVLSEARDQAETRSNEKKQPRLPGL